MRMIHKYDEFCQLHDQGKVKPDVSSPDGYNSVMYLERLGWEILVKNMFGMPRDREISKKLLQKCRVSEDNFKLAHKEAGIDFWIID